MVCCRGDQDTSEPPPGVCLAARASGPGSGIPVDISQLRGPLAALPGKGREGLCHFPHWDADGSGGSIRC